MVLQLNANVPALAATYWSIFFTKQSIMQFDPTICAQACILIACKTTGNKTRVQEVYLAAHHIRNSREGEPHVPSNHDYWRGKQYIILMELAILRELRFGTHIETVHDYVLLFAREIECSVATAHLAYYIANDSLCSSVTILYQPHIVACACLCLALERTKNERTGNQLNQ